MSLRTSQARRGTHIVLAACNRHQSTWEEDGQGIFTRTLLKVMRRTPSRGLTYKSFSHHLVMPPFQTPYLEGKHLHRFLFESSVEFADNSRILCRHVWFFEVSETCLLIHYQPKSLLTWINEAKFTIPVYATKQPDQADLLSSVGRRDYLL
ncbi:hypothetical protein EV421DRAFT_887358 [Armillaria borealis]|uniref:Uncharacterized protein n=1 Tax=Armillaria borealis TaxID=47425 RepID=A0AA39N043_9AGAR|nr:hypothetical protein EV421DRAFT_887358 [Armillaria borealis]